MKANNKNKASIQVTEGTPVVGSIETTTTIDKGQLKKYLIFGVMGLIFAVCLYFIFGSGNDEKANEAIEVGINDAVPQASGNALPTDKGKAYEQEMLQEKERKKRDALMTLSDYWQSDSTAQNDKTLVPTESGTDTEAARTANPAMNSYRAMQRSLGTYYQRKPAQDALKRENEKLKAQLETKQSSQGNTAQDRLALMEKSYQLAAKYFPASAQAQNTEEAKPAMQKGENDFVSVLADKKSVVSRLHGKATDSLVLTQWVNAQHNSFTTAGGQQETVLPPNSIRACIHQTLKVTGESSVQLRLLQDVRIGQSVVPTGFILTAHAKFQGNRLQLQVISIEINGIIMPVDLTVYDLDGQKGLNLPYAPEVTAVNGTLANMGSTSGSSFTVNRSAGQQITSDLTRGAIQGVSGYFSKRVNTQKATLRQGYQVFLVSKKK